VKGWESKNYYELLGVPKNASKAQIKLAYRDIALVYHPDSNFFDEILEGTQQGENQRGGDHSLFKQITAAYHTLSNDEARQAYDRSMPPDLPGWSNVTYDPLAEKAKSYQVAAQRAGKKSGAYGVFGSVPKAPTSAFDHLYGAEIRPASEILKMTRKKGILRRLCELLLGF